MRKKFYLISLCVLVSFVNLKAQTVLSENFESATFPPTGWTIVNAGTGNNWDGVNDVVTYAYNGTGFMFYEYSDTDPANTWAFTPALSLLTTRAYYVTFYVRVLSSAYPERMKFTVGNSNTVASQTTTLLDSSNIANTTYRKWSTVYTPTSNGNYNFAFNCYSLADQYDLLVDSVTIFQGNALAPCAGTPVGGTATASSTVVCTSPQSSTTLSVTGSSADYNLTYQWQSAPVGSALWTNISNATLSNYTAAISASTMFRRITTCPSSGIGSTSSAVTVTATSTPLTLLSPTNTATNVPNLFTLRWNRNTSAASYDVYIGTTSPPTQVINNVDTVLNLSSPVAGTTYYWSVTPKSSSGSSAGCSSAIYSFTTRTRPVNDSCGAAVALITGVATNGEITGATPSPATTITCGSASYTSANDVWYTIMARSNGIASVSVSGNYGATGFNPVIAIYSGSCSVPTLISCSDASTSITETLNLTGLIAGNTYLIRVFANGTVGNGGLTITASGPALPVTGVNLTAIRNSKNVQLSWQSLTEANNAGFEVQRSADGSSFTSFLKIASKAKDGNGTSAINYTAEDEKPFSGANYYRLKQTDKDGKISYSNVVLVKGQAVSNLVLSAIYPNPTRDVLKAAIQSPTAEKITFVISDMAGKIISRIATSVTSGDNTISLNVGNLPSGNYLLKAICSNGCETAVQKFTKQ